MEYIQKLKLSQFLDIIKSQFDDIIGYYTYVVEAEVKSIKQNRQFYYIDLVEIEHGKITDTARSNIFNPVVMSSFLAEVNISDYNELVWKKLLLTVKPTFHKTYWFSANIQKIHWDFFIWSLEKQKKENILLLQNKGILFNNKSKDIWYPTYNIAVITWDKSEWFRDFETILIDSWFNYKITVFKSLVHWEKASEEVLSNLKNIDLKISSWEDINLVAIIRGWGGSEWMNWTNDLDLCEYVCNYKIPVMSAVGHTVDQSILDMVSCYDCKTPSQWAQILIDLYEEFNDNLNSEFEYINNCINDFSSKYKLELNFIWKNFPLLISNRVRGYKSKLESLNIDNKILYQLKFIKTSLESIFHTILSNNPNKILDKWYNIICDKSWKVVKEYKIWDDYIMKGSNWEYLINIKSKI